jgi:non-specific serine/threonine protein kinase
MKKPRGGIAAASVGRRVVVFGGEEGAGTIAEVEMYDPGIGRWTGLPDLRTPRHGLGGVSLGRRIFAIEGGTRPGLYYSNANETLTIAPARIAGR